MRLICSVQGGSTPGGGTLVGAYQALIVAIVMHRILFQIGPLTFYSYGLLIALGFLLAAFLMTREASKYGASKDDVFDCLIAVLISGLIGGRFLFVAINWQLYSREPLRIFMLQEGGMAIQGSLVTAFITGIVVCRAKKLRFWKMCDLIAPYIALGQAVGRVGCFLNGCCYGKVIVSGLGVTFPGETVLRIPTQVYSSLFLLGIFAALLMFRKKRPFDGSVFVLYMILYALFRFGMDFMRSDNPKIFLGITLAQAISVGIFFCGIAFYFALKRKRTG